MERRLLLLFAVACGASLANIYYAQPLLPDIAREFGASDAGAAIVVTVSQIAYSIGLLLIVPLGDLVDRRRLIAGLLLGCAACLAAAAAAPSLGVLAIALALAAMASVVVQILLPFAAVLAPAEERGRVVGEVMTGTLVGALSARTISGLLAALGSWRIPFAFAAVLSVLLAGTLWRALPAREPATSIRYHRLLLSIAGLVRREPALRRRMAYGACGFAGFTLAWTTIPFLLAGPAYGLGPGAIGLFGLAGIAGALAARRLGGGTTAAADGRRRGGSWPRSCSAGRSSSSARTGCRSSSSASSCSTSACRARTSSARGSSTPSVPRTPPASPPPT